ncbi:DUF542 domain-containing protein [Effusibacillus lacus]|uniref:Hemerythrin n=1 Tax=Effusibacillus lacus TaxID=1348429 RepID=A0A292YIM6_9BACL|nr:DUF542 domain-containing protein [Effusibacillus lacus]TCS75511.1 uncharacterized protein DUF542 [Effusibacillus lacus]GAX88976.1 hemerythrin [Effusibacillus lacus]
MKITKETIIEKVLEKYPQSMQVLAALNIDTCCGAHQTIEEGCMQSGKNPEAVVQMLNDLFTEESCGNCGECGCN